MDSDLKYELEKIANLVDDIKRNSLREIKEKLREMDLNEIKYALSDIKSRLSSLESKIQK